MKNFAKTILSLAVISVFFSASIALAASPFPGLTTATKDTKLTADILPYLGKIAGGIIGVLGVVLIVMIIYAGVTWMTASGDSKKVDTAKGMIKNAVIGLILVFAAYAITSFLMGSVTGVTSGSQ